MGTPKVIKRLIEAYEYAKKYEDYGAMADIAITINSLQKEKE
jgi:hypothetical protein